jgi:hypothetical protein
MASLALEGLESLLRARKFDQTLTRHWGLGQGHWETQVASTGVGALDAALEGGWRRGAVSELIGGRSSGRMSVLAATLAAATRRGEVVGLVDAVDRFDPVTAAAAGLDLDRVLWVRGPSLTVGMARPTLLEHAVHQAVRALDLIVRAGGFAVAALDLADVPPRIVRLLPLATWMRIAQVNEGRDTACVLVGNASMGKSARGASVRLEASSQWTGQSAQGRRFARLDIRAEVASARLGPQGVVKLT